MPHNVESIMVTCYSGNHIHFAFAFVTLIKVKYDSSVIVFIDFTKDCYHFVITFSYHIVLGCMYLVSYAVQFRSGDSCVGQVCSLITPQRTE